MGDGGMDSAPGGQSEQDGPSGQESVLWRGELHSSKHLRVFVGRTFGELFNALATEEALAMGLYRPPERDGHPDALPHVRAPATKGFSVFFICCILIPATLPLQVYAAPRGDTLLRATDAVFVLASPGWATSRLGEFAHLPLQSAALRAQAVYRGCRARAAMGRRGFVALYRPQNEPERGTAGYKKGGAAGGKLPAASTGLRLKTGDEIRSANERLNGLTSPY